MNTIENPLPHQQIMSPEHWLDPQRLLPMAKKALTFMETVTGSGHETSQAAVENIRNRIAMVGSDPEVELVIDSTLNDHLTEEEIYSYDEPVVIRVITDRKSKFEYIPGGFSPAELHKLDTLRDSFDTTAQAIIDEPILCNSIALTYNLESSTEYRRQATLAVPTGSGHSLMTFPAGSIHDPKPLDHGRSRQDTRIVSTPVPGQVLKEGYRLGALQKTVAIQVLRPQYNWYLSSDVVV